jgi:hypothetical protein
MYNADQAISGISLASDAGGTLHLAWSEGILINNFQTDPDIYYRTGDGVTWAAEGQVYTLTSESRYPTILTGNDGVSLLWYEGPLADRDIYFSRQTSSGFCQGVAGVSVGGAQLGVVGRSYTFVATSDPQTATLPITYTWQASGQPPVVQESGLQGTASFSWTITNTAIITVTAENCGGAATDSYAILIRDRAYRFYFPLIAKN